jgi:hypothetical protein
MPAPEAVAIDPALRSVLRALTRVCPHDDLVARLVYLVDWRSALTIQRQTTRVEWRIDGRGPRLGLVEAAARQIRAERTLIDRIMPTPTRRLPDLFAGDVESLDHVLKEAALMNRLQLVRLVMSTYPVMTADLDGQPPVADLPAKVPPYDALMAKAAR